MEILFIDDNPGEAYVFKQAIAKISPDIRVANMPYCTDALWVLKAQKPDFLFLSLDAEKKDALFYLRSIKSLKELGSMPVIIYSNALDEQQINAFYKAKANYFLVKPCTFSDAAADLSRIISPLLQQKHKTIKEQFVINNLLAH
jgi:response regulator RpfG family c-di-GMP phosphodiesterase